MGGGKSDCKLIHIGAEAKVYDCGEYILKERIKKSYRHPELDRRIRKLRTKREASLLTRAREAGVPVPRVIATDLFAIKLEKITGKKINEVTEVENLEEKLAEIVSALHLAGIAHNDLTPFNFLVDGEGNIWLIDFGLAFQGDEEDFAVDLKVLRDSFEASEVYMDFEKFLDIYLKFMGKRGKKVLERLKDLEKRGRYKIR